MIAADSARPLDFVVIGASKSGTTSLYQYLRTHPELALAPGKDAPFFSADDWYERGWTDVAAELFAEASPEAYRGTVTPRYMEDPRVPGRMAALMPALKLIAILRNPIDRAFSQYRQQVRRQKESREFVQAVADCLDPGALEGARAATGPIDAATSYLVHGEYARVLTRFAEHFPGVQLRIFFTDELRGAPELVVRRIAEFVGADPGFVPPNLEIRYHQGGTRERFPGLVPWGRNRGLLRGLWRLLPAATRRAVWTWYFTEGNVVAEAAPDIEPSLRRQLAEFFAPDVEQLADLAARRPPWDDFTNLENAS